MAPIVTTSPILFEVIDVFGKEIRITRSYWRVIKEKKHSDLRYSLAQIQETIRTPDNVYESVKDPTIALFRKSFQESETLLVVVKHLNGDGFVVTVYQTSKSQKKVRNLWPE